MTRFLPIRFVPILAAATAIASAVASVVMPTAHHLAQVLA